MVSCKLTTADRARIRRLYREAQRAVRLALRRPRPTPGAAKLNRWQVVTMRSTPVRIDLTTPAVIVTQQDFYESMIDQGWFIVTPDGIESTPEYERFNDGSPAT